MCARAAQRAANGVLIPPEGEVIRGNSGVMHDAVLVGYDSPRIGSGRE